MIDYMRLAHTNAGKWRAGRQRTVVLLLLAVLVAGCSLPVPMPTRLPVEIPGLPSDWGELQGLIEEFGIPDLSDLGNIPGLETLGGLQTPPGGIAFQGPLELSLSAGQTIPGTDIRFVQAESGGDAAQFEIAGLRAPRRMGDSLDFDGGWPGASGVSYHLRLRVYQIGNGQVRAAGVHRVIIQNVQPRVAPVNVEGDEHALRFPHTVTTGAGQSFPGMTLVYSGFESRGAQLAGLPEGEYHYRKIGDSVEWAGLLTPEIPVVYHLRMLYYQEANATVGGVVIVSLPGP